MGILDEWWVIDGNEWWVIIDEWWLIDSDGWWNMSYDWWLIGDWWQVMGDEI